MNGISWLSGRWKRGEDTPRTGVRPLRFESMEQRVVLSAISVMEATDTTKAETDDSVWIDLGYPVQTYGENAIDDQTIVPPSDMEAELNGGSIARSLLESTATELQATDTALEEVYDSSFVDTATATAADDLVGASLDDEYEFRTGKFAQSDYNFEMPKADLSGDSAKDESHGKYETYDYPELYNSDGVNRFVD